jgi:hypothetical protein
MILPPEPANFNDTSMMIDSHQSKSALITVSIERFAKLSVKARSVHNSWRLLKFFVILSGLPKVYHRQTYYRSYGQLKL